MVDVTLNFTKTTPPLQSHICWIVSDVIFKKNCSLNLRSPMLSFKKCFLTFDDSFFNSSQNYHIYHMHFGRSLNTKYAKYTKVGEVPTFRASDTDTDLPIGSADLFNAFQYLKNRFIASKWRFISGTIASSHKNIGTFYVKVSL